MNRYIDIDKAIPIAIQAVVDVVGHGISQVDAVNIADKLEEASAADVAEVRHGEWGFDGVGWNCSECGEYALLVKTKIQVRSKYCPYCGAKMDGERREE